MALSDYLTPEQLEIMLNETYGDQQTQDFIRPNPLQFQYPFIPIQDSLGQKVQERMVMNHYFLLLVDQELVQSFFKM
jgi:hypothetical protein